MGLRVVRAFSVVVAIVVCGGLAAGALPARGAELPAAGYGPASAAAGSGWGTAAPLQGLAALNTGNAAVIGLSCASPGNCAVVGSYKDASGLSQPFLADETNGTWGAAHAMLRSAAVYTGTTAFIASVSCRSAGNCAAGGAYTDSNRRRQAFVLDEVNGSWGRPQQVTGSATVLNLGTASSFTVKSVSCASAGNCLAGGFYTDLYGRRQAFVASESGGSWGTARRVPGPWDPSVSDAEVDSVSCASGNCLAGGQYTDPASGHAQAFAVYMYYSGYIGAEVVPGLDALATGGISYVTSVSCGSAMSCAVGGTYVDSAGGYQSFVADETNGVWVPAQEVPGLAALDTGGLSEVGSVSCASAGNCAAGGFYQDAGFLQAFLADEKDGTWGQAHPVGPSSAAPVTASSSVDAVSCASTGYCVAAGDLIGGTLVAETAGSWAQPQHVPGSAALDPGGSAWVTSVSCVHAGACAAAGLYPDSSGNQQVFVADGTPVAVISPTSTSLSLSAPAAAYGHEQAEKLSATVSSQAGTPAGTVTVTSGTASVCTMTLVSGSGTCTLPATRFPPGTVKLTATYGGGTGFAASASPAQTLTVAKAASATALSLVPATAAYGREQAALLSVAVTPQYGGTPGGKVTIKTGTTALCTVTLASGKGSCRLSPARLPGGAWHLAASYAGDSSYLASASTAKTLTAAKAASRTTLALSAGKVTYGKEQAERLSVTVAPQYSGTPSGKVTIKTGATTLCTITLASGKASCTLAPTKLRPGTYALTAVYSGSGNFASSASTRKTLTVAR